MRHAQRSRHAAALLLATGLGLHTMNRSNGKSLNPILKKSKGKQDSTRKFVFQSFAQRVASTSIDQAFRLRASTSPTCATGGRRPAVLARDARALGRREPDGGVRRVPEGLGPRCSAAADPGGGRVFACIRSHLASAPAIALGRCSR